MRWFISILVALALVAGLWWMEQQRQAEIRPEPGIDIPAEPVQPEPRYPLPKPEIHPAPPEAEAAEEVDESEPAGQPDLEPAPSPPLPDLSDSDTLALEALSDLLGGGFVQQWIKPEFVIPRAVAVINSLDGDAPSMKTWPLAPVDTEARTEAIEDSEKLLWTEANTERYEALVAALVAVPPEQAAANYARSYPLFQQAWDELGETEPYFNDRLIDLVDHLLATPQAELPLEVVVHEDRLQFADESLEEASWGRKVLIRMGTAHAGQVKEWLREFRNAAIEEADPPRG